MASKDAVLLRFSKYLLYTTCIFVGQFMVSKTNVATKESSH